MNVRKRRNSESGLAILNYYSLTKQQNEYRVNRLTGYHALATQISGFIILLLNYVGLFILDTSKVFFAVGCMLPFSMSSFAITVIAKIEKQWVKYFTLSCVCMTIMILFMFLSMHVVLLLLFPIIVSCLYFDKRLFIFEALETAVAMLIGHILSYSLSIVFDDPLVQSMYHALVFGFVPRFCEYVLTCLAVYLFIQISSKMVKGGYDYAQKAEDLIQSQKNTNYEIVKNLATVSENKSNDIGEHISRVFNYMYVLAYHFGYTADECYDISLAAMLHDVGKLGVDEKILSKPAKLTGEEFEEVKKHAAYGKQLLSNSSNQVLEIAAMIADQHHERWDGQGYHGLKGDEIDRVSCMMSVVDVFDALTSKRCYKDAWPKEQAYAEIVKGRGTQFSPEVVDKFVEHFDEISEIYEANRDIN